MHTRPVGSNTNQQIVESNFYLRPATRVYFIPSFRSTIGGGLDLTSDSDHDYVTFHLDLSKCDLKLPVMDTRTEGVLFQFLLALMWEDGAFREE